MSLYGSLDSLSVAELLRIVSSERRSGSLYVVGPEGAGRVALYDGDVVFATCDRCPRLGQVLTEKGLLTEDQLSAMLAEQLSGAKRKLLGSLLVDKGLVSPRDLGKLIRRHVVSICAEIFNLRRGFCCFERHRPLEERPVWESRLSVETLLLRVAHLSDEPDREWPVNQTPAEHWTP